VDSVGSADDSSAQEMATVDSSLPVQPEPVEALGAADEVDDDEVEDDTMSSFHDIDEESDE
jgi:hypothetical protein